jgi:hypothetical protein
LLKEAEQMERKWVGYQVHGYRTPDNQDIEIVTRVVAVGNHRYDNGQGETAIKAATNDHPRPRWYVGYGGNYVPANKQDIANIIL